MESPRLIASIDFMSASLQPQAVRLSAQAQERRGAAAEGRTHLTEARRLAPELFVLESE